MKLVIAGSRHIDLFKAYNLIEQYKSLIKSATEIISGGCQGVDQAANMYAYNYGIPYIEFPADWEEHGKAAGPIRNNQMAEYGDMLLLIWDGKSRGSSSMKKAMIKQKKPVYEIFVGD